MLELGSKRLFGPNLNLFITSTMRLNLYQDSHILMVCNMIVTGFPLRAPWSLTHSPVNSHCSQPQLPTPVHHARLYSHPCPFFFATLFLCQDCSALISELITCCRPRLSPSNVSAFCFLDTSSAKLAMFLVLFVLRIHLDFFEFLFLFVACFLRRGLFFFSFFLPSMLPLSQCTFDLTLHLLQLSTVFIC